jgi:RNA-binding protein YhbY
LRPFAHSGKRLLQVGRFGLSEREVRQIDSALREWIKADKPIVLLENQNGYLSL